MWTNLCIHITSLLKFRDLRARRRRKGFAAEGSSRARAQTRKEPLRELISIASASASSEYSNSSGASIIPRTQRPTSRSSCTRCALAAVQHVHTCSWRDRRHHDASCLSIMPLPSWREKNVAHCDFVCASVVVCVPASESLAGVCIDRTDTGNLISIDRGRVSIAFAAAALGNIGARSRRGNVSRAHLRL